MTYRMAWKERRVPHVSRRWHHPANGPRRQRGAGAVEYIIITGITLGVLLVPFGENNTNAIDRLIQALKNRSAAYLYSASLPTAPDPDGFLGGDADDGIGGGGGNGAGGGTGGTPGGGSSGGGSGDGDSGDGTGDGDTGSDNSGGSGNGGDAGDESEDTSGGDVSGGGGSDGVGLDEQLAAVSVLAELACLASPDETPGYSDRDKAAFAAADAVYADIGDEDEDEEKIYSRGGEGFAENGIAYDPPEGFAAGLTQTADGQWILAFRGTQFLSGPDWRNNYNQAMNGQSEQYDYAVTLAQEAQDLLESEVLLVGHSLGGGLAAAAAYEIGGDAITFNAAGLHPNYKDGKTAGDIRNHYVIGDVLTTLQTNTPFPDAAGTQIGHSASCAKEPIQRHLRSAFDMNEDEDDSDENNSGNPNTAGGGEPATGAGAELPVFEP